MLLEHVVDGPELDLIWTGFNPDEITVVDDDEENEARLQHPGGADIDDE